MSVEFEKWTVVSRRRFRPVLRIRDGDTGRYLTEDGYLDCFDSPQAADLAIAATSGSQPGEHLGDAREAFERHHVAGTLSADLLAANPFNDEKTLLLAADECRWDDEGGCFVVGNEELAKFSVLLHVVSLSAQRDVASFIETCLHRGPAGIVVRELRILSVDWLRRCRSKLYKQRGSTLRAAFGAR